MTKPTFVYVTYITTTLEKLWEALTSEAFMEQYWQDGQLQSEWLLGSSIQQVNSDGSKEDIGEVLESEPPYRLAYSFQPSSTTPGKPYMVRFYLEQYGNQVKLTLIHSQLNTTSCMSLHQRWIDSLCEIKRLLEMELVLALVA